MRCQMSRSPKYVKKVSIICHVSKNVKKSNTCMSVYVAQVCVCCQYVCVQNVSVCGQCVYVCSKYVCVA